MSVNEGNTIQYTVNTAKVADGTTLYWRTTGNVNYGLCGASQISGSNNGTITVTNNQGVFNVSLNLNQFTDNTRTLGVGLSTSQWGPIVGATAQAITINDTSKTPQYTYTVNYAVIGGGGEAVVAFTGGGGAGGVVMGSAIFGSGNVYTIIVGGGGTSPAIPLTTFPGAPSTLSGPSPSGFTPVTAFGGGAAGIGSSPVPSGTAPGSPSNASGGGGGSTNTNAPGAGGTGGPQGHNGGSGVGAGCFFAGGGGGGALTAGTNGVATPTSATGGNGGSGITWPYTGGSIYYAGGGAGTGNGGPGVNQGTSGLGQNNYGGGGSPGTSRIGANGAILLAIPTPFLSQNASYGPLASNPPAAPGYTILTFTANGTYIA
jgi:hypothetical protein